VPRTIQERLARQVLLAPALVRRAAAGRATEAAERWILEQSKHVRQSYVREVLDRNGEHPHAEEIWMLRQSDAVRESYVREVLEG